MSLASALSLLKLGENRLKEMLILLEEVSKRDHLTIREIFQKSEIQNILGQKETTPSQKTEQLKKVLLTIRYPKRHQLEQSFEQKRRSLDLPPHAVIDHSPHFEDKSLKITFQFKTMEEYRSILSAFTQLTDSKELEEMIRNQ
jgi:hypothetical protein